MLEDSDIVVTSGGVSMGSLDLIKGIPEDIGTVHFGRMCMNLGNPQHLQRLRLALVQ